MGRTPDEEAKYLKVEMTEMVRSMNRQARSRARRAVNILRNAAIETLAGQRSGKIYKLPHEKTTYQASAPGEVPAVRTGNLRRNWRQQVLGYGGTGGNMKLIVRIKSDMPYAGYLETGTSRMEARPYRKKIADAAKPGIAKIYGENYIK